MDLESRPPVGSNSAAAPAPQPLEWNFRAMAHSPTEMAFPSTAPFSSDSRTFRLPREQSRFWAIPAESNRITTRGAYGTNETADCGDQSSRTPSDSSRLHPAGNDDRDLRPGRRPFGARGHAGSGTGLDERVPI